ncbi:MAG: SDR family NAD(P)-dependent oxidoreductase [Clostridia bacterium]|nr:SDR family NAD(P)-dependent oxidoreductase [Clostridia bacterium]
MIVWITGASSGLGLHTARQLKLAGLTVVAGARSFEGREGEGEEGYRLPLDVKDEASMDRFVERALSLYGPPDALCCCAGVLTLGACEEYTRREFVDVLETNFLGEALMVSRALPLMRKAGRGKIALFTSINGLLGVPYQGAYTASKHAIEGYAECLRMETAPFGISVCVVEPGDHQSGSQKYRRHARTKDPESPYYADYQKAVSQIAHDEENGSDPDILGKRLARALQRKRLPARLIIGKADQHLAVLLHRLLPARLFSRLLSFYYMRHF